MIRKLMALPALAGALAFSACEGEIAFTWTGEFSVDFGGTLDTTAGGDGASTNKQIEINLTIDPGNGIVDEEGLADGITLTQRWLIAAGQLSTQAFLDDKINAGSFEAAAESKTLDYKPIYAEVNADGKVDTRFVVTLQYGWNCFEVTGTIGVRDSKGNTDDRPIDQDPTYIFGDFGDTIPFKVALEWDSYGADMDLVMRELPGTLDEDWVYWGNMGYNEIGCYSTPPAVVASPPTSCYQEEYYIVGEERKTGFSYGSLDKDDIVRGGPEFYTLDPRVGKGAVDPNPNLPMQYADGDLFEVYVAYYEDDSASSGSAGQMSNGVVSIYLNGSETPECYQTGDKAEAKIASLSGSESQAERVAEFGAALATQLWKIGTVTYVAAGPTFTFAEAPGVATATETNGFCSE